MRKLVGKLKENGVETIVLTPSPFDDTSTITDKNGPHTNDGLKEIASRAKAIAKEFGATVIDFHAPMTKINLELQAKDPKATVIGPDRVHPGAGGHALMTYLFLKAQQVPGIVASVSIKAKGGALAASDRCKVDEIKATANTLTFRYLADSLPYPMDSSAAKADQWVPITEELNREMLQVTDLPAGNYRLDIDGVKIHDFTAEELSKGVNLATCHNTPQYQQAEKVRLAYTNKQNLVGKLRALAKTEHDSIPGKPAPSAPISPEQMELFLQKRLSSVTGTPYENFVANAIKSYRENKPHEDEWKKQIDEILVSLRETAKPTLHVFLITPAN